MGAQVVLHQDLVGRGHAQTLDLLEGRDGAHGGGVAERGACEAELHVLDGRGARVEQQVAARDAGVDRAGADVHGDVAGSQEEELDVVVRVREHELTGVAALAVAGFAEHVDGGLGQGALVGDGDAEHEILAFLGEFRGKDGGAGRDRQQLIGDRWAGRTDMTEGSDPGT